MIGLTETHHGHHHSVPFGKFIYGNDSEYDEAFNGVDGVNRKDGVAIWHAAAKQDNFNDVQICRLVQKSVLWTRERHARTWINYFTVYINPKLSKGEVKELFTEIMWGILSEIGMQKEKQHIVLMGDLNKLGTEWADKNLPLYGFKKTHTQNTLGHRKLDQMWVSKEIIVKKAEYFDNFNKHDHSYIYAELLCEVDNEDW